MSGLPVFRYHPDPLATGSVKASSNVCACCGDARGFIYTASVYAAEVPREALCPWCIADGTAARKFNATFSDDSPLAEAGLADEIIREVSTLTPGYSSWQEEVWLSCCEDACEFHGDASAEELLLLKGEELERILSAWGWKRQNWDAFMEGYRPAGDPAVYKFLCRHCRVPKYAVDFT